MSLAAAVRVLLGLPLLPTSLWAPWWVCRRAFSHNLTAALNKSLPNVRCNYVWHTPTKDPVNKVTSTLTAKLLVYLYSINVLKSSYREKYLNCHKYKLMLCMFTHVCYCCITGRLYHCTTLTFTAMALCCGVPKYSGIHVWNCLSQHT